MLKRFWRWLVSDDYLSKSERLLLEQIEAYRQEIIDYRINRDALKAEISRHKARYRKLKARLQTQRPAPILTDPVQLVNHRTLATKTRKLELDSLKRKTDQILKDKASYWKQELSAANVAQEADETIKELEALEHEEVEQSH